MGFCNYISRKTDNLLASSSALAGGLLLGQFPQYLAQYLQRLGGHVDEARMAAETFQIDRLYKRAEILEEGLDAINNSGTLERLIEFVKHMDIKVAKRALENYTPGMTFDREGLLYCGIGALGGLIVYEGVKGVFWILRRGQGLK